MNELVFKSSKGNPVTTSLIVAEIFEKEHRHVLESISNLAADNSAAKFFHKSSYENRGKQYPMYFMNQSGFSLLVMGFTGEKALQFKIRFIEAFNAMEAKLKEANPTTLSKLEILQMAIESEKKVIALEAENKVLSPKADLADRLIDTETRIDIGQAAKLLKLPYGRNTFFKELRDRGIFFKNRNEPKQEYVERGYFQLFMVVIPTENHGDISKTKIVVPQKGLSWLAKQFGANINNHLPNLNTAI
jgi:anti-repressor protein